MEEVIARLEPLLEPRRIRRMQAVLATRSNHVAFVFEQMVDPHNLSAVLRSLDAFSFQDAYLVDPAAGLARGITTGTERWLTLHRPHSNVTCVRALRRAGYRIYASHVAPGRGETLAGLDFRRKLALVFGNEHAGVSAEMLALCDDTFRIEQHGFVESLNLSVAAAICAHHARREIARLSAEPGAGERYLLPPRRRRKIYARWLRRSVRRADLVLAAGRRAPAAAPAAGGRGR